MNFNFDENSNIDVIIIHSQSHTLIQTARLTKSYFKKVIVWYFIWRGFDIFNGD